MKNNSIKHIHEVLFMMQKENKTYKSKEEFLKEIENNFGSDIIFQSCNDNGINLQEVIPFLLDRDKIRINNEGHISLHPDMTMCNGHEDEHHHHH